MPIMAMKHDIDPKDAILKRIGNIDDVQIYHNQVLVAVYVRPELTKGGIALPSSYVKEDRNQGKVGLVIKMGPDAFVDSSQKWFKNMSIELLNWVIFRPSDGWAITLPGGDDGTLCRILDDVDVKGSIIDPDKVW
jgi:co-chaperonin GroES (HSP10)